MESQHIDEYLRGVVEKLAIRTLKWPLRGLAKNGGVGIPSFREPGLEEAFLFEFQTFWIRRVSLRLRLSSAIGSPPQGLRDRKGQQQKSLQPGTKIPRRLHIGTFWKPSLIRSSRRLVLLWESVTPDNPLYTTG
jgi:hypothetical protein